MIEFFFDFETRSRADLAKVGATKYALDPSTEATLLTWAIDNGPIRAWRKGQPIPSEIINVALNPRKYKFIAQNVEFDYLIWNHVFMPSFAGMRAPLKIEQLACTMAMGQRFGAGRGLDGISSILHLNALKDKKGRALMLKQCKPNDKGVFPELTADEWDQFETYGKMDTELLRKAYRILPPLSPAEHWAWQWTVRRNMAGLRVDVPLINGLKRLLQLESPNLDAEFSLLVGHQFKVTQREKCLVWFQQYIPSIPDMKADTIEAILLEPPPGVPKDVLRALEIKSIAGSASVKKVAVALLRLHIDRIHGNLVYNGAITKRWAGQGLQVHNFPRVDRDALEGDIFQILHMVTHYPEIAHAMVPDTIELVKNLLRRMFIPDDGMVFYCGDYSKIEPTVLFWLVGLGTPSKTWYEEIAAEIYGTTPDKIFKDTPERQLGKETGLGGGYGMGKVKFKITCLKKGIKISIELAEKAINTYRRRHKKVVDFWADITKAFGDALGGKTTVLCNGKISVGAMTGKCKGVYIELPSKSRLYYHDASWSDGGLIFQQAKKGGVIDKHTYGGLLTEHIVSATARDIMLQGMFNTEKVGLPVLNTVHDELWAQGVPGRLAEFKASMLKLPPWASDLHLEADVSEGSRYLK